MSLLELPRELCNCIYTFVKSKPRRRKPYTNCVQITRAISTCVLLVCKRMYCELVEEWQLHCSQLHISGSPNFCHNALNLRFNYSNISKFICRVDITMVALSPQRHPQEQLLDEQQNLNFLPNDVIDVLNSITLLGKFMILSLSVKPLATYVNTYNVRNVENCTHSLVVQQDSNRNLNGSGGYRKTGYRCLVLQGATGGSASISFLPLEGICSKIGK